jgi:hypothetical protein
VESILGAFLNVGMLDMVEDDAKLEHLKQTSQDLAAKPSKNRNDVITSTLVALDPESPPNEPIFEKAETALKKHWQTVKAKFPDIPRQLLRAVLLEALRLRGEKDETTATIIWLTGASYLPYSQLGREKQICGSLITEMGNIAEKKAIQEWTTSYQFKALNAPKFSVNSEIEPPTINRDALTKHLEAASGPTNAAGEGTGPDPTTIWPTSGQQWSQKFAPRAATGIAEVVDGSYTALLSGIVDLLREAGTDLGGRVESINSTIDSAMKEFERSANVAARRSELMWWRQTLYSHSLMLSYRQLDSVDLPLLMSYDLHNQIPDSYPQSVEFLLREAVRHVVSAEKSRDPKGFTALEFCEGLQASPHASMLTKALGSDVDDTGRVTLLSAIKTALLGKPIDAANLSSRVGIPGSTKIRLEDLAVWIFRDLQAHHLAIQK